MIVVAALVAGTGCASDAGFAAAERSALVGCLEAGGLTRVGVTPPAQGSVPDDIWWTGGINSGGGPFGELHQESGEPAGHFMIAPSARRASELAGNDRDRRSAVGHYVFDWGKQAPERSLLEDVVRRCTDETEALLGLEPPGRINR